MVHFGASASVLLSSRPAPAPPLTGCERKAKALAPPEATKQHCTLSHLSLSREVEVKVKAIPREWMI